MANIQKTDYKGFQIDRHFNIYKGGKQVFTASWQHCTTLEDAKEMIDSSVSKSKELTNFQQRQENKYGNIVDPVITYDGRVEGTEEEMERFAEWMNEMAERQLLD